MGRKQTSGAATIGAGLAYAVLWSSGFVGAELGTREQPASVLLMWRYLIVAPLLVAVCLIRRVRPSRAVLGRQLVIGALCQVGYLAAITLAVQHGVPAGTTALIAALQPMLVAAVAGRLLGERLHRVGWIGLAVGFVGVGCVVAGDLGSGQSPGWWMAVPLAGTLCLSAGTVLGRRWPAPPTVLESITVQTSVAAVAFTGLNAVAGAMVVPTSPGFWPAVGWVVVLSTFGGYGSYLFVLRQQGATRVSTWLYLSPPITALWVWLMFGERLGVAGVTGLLISAVGVVLVLRGSNRSDRSDWSEPAERSSAVRRNPGASARLPDLSRSDR